MTKAEIATEFLKMAGRGDVQEAYEKYVATSFIHHNQFFKGDRQSLLLAMEEAHKNNPNKAIEIKKVYVDGNAVITHSRVLKQEAEIAVVHIFRFEGNQIVELWDLGQIINKDSPNQNGLF